MNFPTRTMRLPGFNAESTVDNSLNSRYLIGSNTETIRHENSTENIIPAQLSCDVMRTGTAVACGKAVATGSPWDWAGCAVALYSTTKNCDLLPGGWFPVMDL